MKTKNLPVPAGIVFLFIAALWLRADEVEMQNGDRYFGQVLSVSDDTVVLQSEVLGKINVPRKNVAGLAFGTNAVTAMTTASTAQISTPTNLPAAPSLNELTGTNANDSAILRNLDADTNVIQKIREQMLSGSPEATAKYDELVNGLMSGSLNMDDLRREARADADQLRALKHDLGPDAGDAIDGYLDVLDDFIKESDSSDRPTNAVTVPQPRAQSR
jgi:hypothetical protein